MSITNDIRSYADTALEQGKNVVGQAQAQLTDVTGQANEFVGKLTGTAKDNVSGFTSKATGAVNDLRAQAEKTINLEAIKSAVEPYLAQAKQYRSTVTDRAEGLYGSVYKSVKSDKRVAKVLETAESLTGVVVETVQDRVVKPVVSLTGRGTAPAPAARPAAKRTTTTKPAAKRTTTTKPAATRPAATRTAAKKAPAKKATTARKAPAKKATQS
jgi:uncharacterized protein YjbJ (UPF0337 family)